MRWWGLMTLLGLLCLLTGCPVGTRSVHRGALSRGLKPRSLVETLAAYDQLGDVWKQLSGARSIHDIYASMDAQRALIRLRGWGGPALWYDQGAFSLAYLGNEPTFIDPSQGLMYKIKARPEEKTDSLTGYRLPKRELTVTHDIPRGELLNLAPQPADRCAWYAIRCPADEQRKASLEIGWFNAQQLFGVTLQLPPDTVPPEDARLVPLCSGNALVQAGSALYLVERDGTQQRLEYELPADRDCLLAADGANPRVFWVYLTPRAEQPALPADEDGKPKRASATRLPGELIAADLDHGELARLTTGAAAFSKIAGDWDRRRALLAQKNTGVALADFEQQHLSWLLRQGPDTPAYLLPGGQVWAFTDDRIVHIDSDELLELAAKLTAGEMLTRDQADMLRPVIDALGWKWTETQVSPLTGGEGELAFFDTGDLAASLAEFVWDIENKRVAELQLTRTPSASDQALLAGTEDDGDFSPSEQLLAALGWPGAKWLEDKSYCADDEVKALYELKPDQRPPGIFVLWITAGATFMQLESEGAFEPQTQPDTELPPDENAQMDSEGGEVPPEPAGDAEAGANEGEESGL